MKELLVICGPTASGKTGLAIELAKKFSGEIVSADSRQVYRYMDIGTGKDLPVSSEHCVSNVVYEEREIGYYEVPEGIRIWGYDLVWPYEEFSVKNYYDIATSVIGDIYERGKLPILTGGTGLYIKAVVEGLDRIHIPRNISLRKELAHRSADELFELLRKIKLSAALSLNESDRKNPRRLIRAIELASVKSETRSVKSETNSLFDDVLMVGLRVDNSELYGRIEGRVEERLRNGFEGEVKFLQEEGFLEGAPSVTLGYQQWVKYLGGEMSRIEAIEEWKKSERQYVKRQMTWFKKDKRVVWLARDQVEDLVEKWYFNK